MQKRESTIPLLIHDIVSIFLCLFSSCKAAMKVESLQVHVLLLFPSHLKSVSSVAKGMGIMIQVTSDYIEEKMKRL